MRNSTPLLIVSVVLLLILIVVVVFYANPLRVASLNNRIVALESEVASGLQLVDRLRGQIDSMSVTEVKLQTSLRDVGGDGVYEFVRVDGKAIFPNQLQLPNSRDDINNSHVLVGSRFRFVPSNNWSVRMSGTRLDLVHPASIWGSVRSVGIRERVAEAGMQDILRDFFKGFPATTITYRRVHIDEVVSGLFAQADIVIDGKNNSLMVGFVNRGESAVLMMFLYEDNDTGVQKELVDSFIRSGSFGDSRIRLE